MRSLRRWRPLIFLVTIWLLFMYYLFRDDVGSASEPPIQQTAPKPRPATGHHDAADVEDIFKNGPAENGGQIGADHWWSLPRRFPVENPQPVPQVKKKWSGGKIPKIQAPAPSESEAAKEVRLKRQAAVKESFVHSWGGYKKYAWLSDEVTPLTGRPKNPFGGWAATLVDTLDSLLIMGLDDEFEEAAQAAETVDFSKTKADRINVFETTIRYLGGYLSAYELSGKRREGLLRKAVEVAELLLCAFDTRNHMPIARWDWKYYMTGHEQMHTRDVLVSELGSLTMEFTKLSQLTGDARYYDAVQRITDLLEAEQFNTKLPGLWPVTIGMKKDQAVPDLTGDNFFTIGGMADSLYEYFPKQYLLLGGALEQPRRMYEGFIEAAKAKLFRRVYNPDDRPIVISGDVEVKRTNWGVLQEKYISKGQHLTCFAGGMVGLAAKVFDRPADLDLAAQLTDGCVWAYASLPTGLMPELFRFAPCGGVEESQTGENCAWDERAWRAQVRDHFAGDNLDKLAWDPKGPEMDKLLGAKGLPPGFVEMVDKRYILRPEAIESVFLMYRLTGDNKWADTAWRMFEAVEGMTRSGIAAAGVKDVTGMSGPDHIDSMESFWLAETLKYFYLVFSEWDLVDLDTWVLNTEAHPLHRPDVA